MKSESISVNNEKGQKITTSIVTMAQCEGDTTCSIANRGLC